MDLEIEIGHWTERVERLKVYADCIVLRRITFSVVVWSTDYSPSVITMEFDDLKGKVIRIMKYLFSLCTPLRAILWWLPH